VRSFFELLRASCTASRLGARLSSARSAVDLVRDDAAHRVRDVLARPEREAAHRRRPGPVDEGVRLLRSTPPERDELLALEQRSPDMKNSSSSCRRRFVSRPFRAAPRRLDDEPIVPLSSLTVLRLLLDGEERERARGQ
jgi:hypothetical protein